MRWYADQGAHGALHDGSGCLSGVLSSSQLMLHTECLLSRLALDWRQTSGLIDRWKTVLYRANLLELPQKLGLWGGKIDHRVFPANSPEQVQVLVAHLSALAFRIKAVA